MSGAGRYIVYGAGAIGGTIGAALAVAGREVVLIARGAHLDAMRRDGLVVETPDGTLRPEADAVASPRDVRPGAGDVVIMAMKSQHTEAALVELAAAAAGEVAVVCAQNGVENERLAARRFDHVYGLCVYLPATHLHPGLVAAHAAPTYGILDVGRFPAGVDDAAERIAGDLRAASFSARPDPAIMRWKYAKLLANLGNALDAACGFAARQSDLYRRAQDEARACYAAAGVAVASREEELARRTDLPTLRPAGGVNHQGSSSWQSLERRSGSIEADWLNGEICLLGRLHGVPTPVNAMLQAVANRMAREGTAPGSLTVEQLEAWVH